MKVVIVIYRACPLGNPDKNRPINPKIELIRACFTSFLRAFEGIDYQLKVLIDKPNAEIREIFKGYDVEESYYADFNEGNIKSFHRQIDLAIESGDQRFLLVEDDYFWLPEAGKVIYETDFGLFTPYLHPGYFTEDAHAYKKNVLFHANHYWMNVISTTLTFGGDTGILEAEKDTIYKYGWADHPMFCDITQRRKLYAPIPTLATHMETEHLSLGFNL